MTEATGALALDHLRHIKARVGQIADSMDDLRSRMSSLQSVMASKRPQFIHGDNAASQIHQQEENP